jgi:hypothetical protein
VAFSLSVSAFAANNGRDGLKQKFDICVQGLTVKIILVKLDLLWKRYLGATHYLPNAGQTRFGHQAHSFFNRIKLDL